MRKNTKEVTMKAKEQIINFVRHLEEEDDDIARDDYTAGMIAALKWVLAVENNKRHKRQ
jgi:hypothetical protein